MSQAITTADETPSRADSRREDIRRAAVETFMQRGFRATSMAQIAAAAGVSRPALYQYYANKEDVLAAAFAKVFEERTAAAIDALNGSADTFVSIDGMLQRFEGDLWALTSASPHHVELIEAKNDVVNAAVQAALAPLWVAVEAFLQRQAPGRSIAMKTRRADWLSLLRWSPIGLKYDEPSVDDYRRRLTSLARSVAADIIDTR